MASMAGAGDMLDVKLEPDSSSLMDIDADTTGAGTAGFDNSFPSTRSRLSLPYRAGNSHRRSEDLFNSVNLLHNAFVVSIMDMQTRLHIFDVIDEWMIDIERALNVDRCSDPDISEGVYQRLSNMLKIEYETWDLLKTLYFDRLSIKDEGEPVIFNQKIYDKFHLDDMTFAQAIIRGDRSLQEMQAVISWLELNYSRKGDPDLTEKLVAWEQTLESLKGDKLLGRSGGSMVTHIDPDAPTREDKYLHPLDAEEELRIQRGTFHYLRTGSIEKAMAFLHESGHIAKAGALLGSCLSQKESTSVGEVEMVDDDIVVSSGENLPRTSEYPPESGLQPKPQPDFIVCGNPARDLWKNVAWNICEQDGVPKWERAVIGTCCGHRQAMLDVAKSWDDKLWAYLKTAVDVEIEGSLRALNTVSKHIVLPPSYWNQGLQINEILGALDKTEKSSFTIEYMFKLLQQCVMTNDIDKFVESVQENIETLIEYADHPLILDHLLRFLTHVLLVFSIVELSYCEPLTNMACEAYITVLVKNGLFVSIPFYINKLSADIQVSVTVKHISVDQQYSLSDIREFLRSAADNELDLLGIAVAVVDKMRDEMPLFDVDTLQWIISCYDLVENQSAVMLEYLRYAVWISRKYLTLGDLERVKKLIKLIPPQCIVETEGRAPTLVREFVCYREYLKAEDTLMVWKKAKSQRPTLENFPESALGSNIDRVFWERRKHEFEIAEEKWKKTVDFHEKQAIDGFMKILKFPDGGWLQGCCNPSDEDEMVHINAVRRIIMKKVTFIVLNLMKERNAVDTFREFVYVVCESRRRILDEFTPTEIGSIFRVVEEFTRSNGRDLMVLPR